VHVVEVDLRMKERGDVGHLCRAQRKSGHAAIGTAVGDDRAEKIAILIVTNERGTNQIGAAAAGGILSVTRPASRHERLAAALDRFRLSRVLVAGARTARRRALWSGILSSKYDDDGKNGEDNEC
jgi:hypothetical protein